MPVAFLLLLLTKSLAPSMPLCLRLCLRLCQVLCFSWSRMAVVDSGTVKGRLKSCRLPFEGYMEVDVKSTHLTL